MMATQAPLPTGAAQRPTYTVRELKRLAPIAKARGDLTTYALICAAVARMFDEDALRVSEQAAAVLAGLEREP